MLLTLTLNEPCVWGPTYSYTPGLAIGALLQNWFTCENSRNQYKFEFKFNPVYSVILVVIGNLGPYNVPARDLGDARRI